MPIFGSDGFRCKYGTNFLTEEFIKRFATCLAYYYVSEGFSKPIVIARDTRKSGELIQKEITDICLEKGIEVFIAGVLPTPGISKILENGDYAFGCMITASHNPPEDNGIKLLRGDGFKIDLDAQEKIESLMTINYENIVNKFTNSTSGVISVLDKPYNEYINSVINEVTPIKTSTRVLIDCSNGANSHNLESIDIFKNFTFISNEPDGNNINLNCGALEPKILLKHMKNLNIDYGVAFDGDGDRAIFVSKEYGLIETEKIALLFFRMLFENGSNNKVVTTEISNLSMQHNMVREGGELIETPVGDRHVIEAVLEHNALFGFEPSGHFYFPTVSNSMDGVAALLHFLKILNNKTNLDKSLEDITHYKRIQKNFDITQNTTIDENNILETISKIIDYRKEKIVIRKSMWDPVLRIYYDFIETNNFKMIENSLDDLIKNIEIKEI